MLKYLKWAFFSALLGSPALALEDADGCRVTMEVVRFTEVQILGQPGEEWPTSRDVHFKVVEVKEEASGPMCDLLQTNPQMTMHSIDERFAGMSFSEGQRFEANVVRGVPAWMNANSEYRNTLAIAPETPGAWSIEHGLWIEGT